MEKEQRIFEAEGIVSPSLSIRPTQTLKDKPESDDAPEAEMMFKFLSAELISDLIERIKAL